MTQRGFTLLEILIAVAIFSLVSMATFSMLQITVKSSERFDEKANYLVELQRMQRLLQQDFSQVIARPIRDEFGDELPAVMTEGMNWGVAVEFTRTGRLNPLKKMRSNLQRVRYFFDGEHVIRRTWKKLDRAPAAPYFDQVVLKNVKTWNVILLGKSDWVERWPNEPSPYEGDDTIEILPRAFEVTVTLLNERQFKWLFSVFPQIKEKTE